MLPTKTGRHDNNIAEILLKVVLKHQKSNQSRMLKGTFKVNYNLINKIILIYIIIHFIYFRYYIWYTSEANPDFSIGLRFRLKMCPKGPLTRSIYDFHNLRIYG